MSRASCSVEPGRIDRVSVVQLADDPDRCLLALVGDDARVLLEVRVDDLAKIASACRDAVKRREEERRMDALAAEAEPIPSAREMANAILSGGRAL